MKTDSGLFQWKRKVISSPTAVHNSIPTTELSFYILKSNRTLNLEWNCRLYTTSHYMYSVRSTTVGCCMWGQHKSCRNYLSSVQIHKRYPNKIMNFKIMVSRSEIKLKRLTWYWHSYYSPASQITSTDLFQFRINFVTILCEHFIVLFGKQTDPVQGHCAEISEIRNEIRLCEQSKYYVTTVMNKLYYFLL